MRKILMIAVFLLSSQVFASDYGYRDLLDKSNRDFMSLGETTTLTFAISNGVDNVDQISARWSIIDYCAIEGGILYAVKKDDFGVVEFATYDESKIASTKSLPKEARFKAFSEGKSADFELVDGATKKLRESNNWVCKAGNTVKFTATYRNIPSFGGFDARTAYMVEHGREVQRDGVKKYSSGQKNDISLKDKYSTMSLDTFLDDEFSAFLGKKVKREVDRFNLDNLVQADSSSSVSSIKDFSDMYKFESFCEAKKGRFYKDGISYRDALKEIVKSENGRVISSSGTGTNYTKVNRLSGKYACIGGESEFMIVADGLSNPYMFSKFLLKTGFEQSFMSLGTQTSNKKSARSNESKVNASNLDTDTYGMAYEVAKSKRPVSSVIGGVEIIGIYNGQINGCDSVSLRQKISSFKKVETKNYLVCNGNVSETGETNTLEQVPSDIKKSFSNIARMCQRQGGFSSVSNGYLINCKPVRDASKCNVEISILNNTGQLIDKQILSGCN